MNLRTQLRNLARVADARRPAGKLVITCAATGTDLAGGRTPGVYGRTGGWAADVVFDGPEPTPALLEQARARLGRTALIVVLGPAEVPPPAGLPV